MILTKKCPQCGQKFQTQDHRARYCSPECQREAHRKAARDWARQHRQKDKAGDKKTI